MTRVDEDEVLLLWRSLQLFRSGRAPACAPRGSPPRSPCPLHSGCDRWTGPDDDRLRLEETVEETEARRSSWPCSRLLDALSPQVRRIG